MSSGSSVLISAISSLVGLDPSQPFTFEARVQLLEPGHSGGGFLILGNSSLLGFANRGSNTWNTKWVFGVGNETEGLRHLNGDYDHAYDGEMIHVAGVFDGRIVRLFLGGVLVDAPLLMTPSGEESREVDAATFPGIEIRLFNTGLQGVKEPSMLARLGRVIYCGGVGVAIVIALLSLIALLLGTPLIYWLTP